LPGKAAFGREDTAAWKTDLRLCAPIEVDGEARTGGRGRYCRPLALPITPDKAKWVGDDDDDDDDIWNPARDFKNAPQKLL
jgi:hypothetical protein